MSMHFYGKRKWADDIALKVRLGRRERDLANCRLPDLYKPSIFGPNHVWKIFYKQQEAFKFCDEFQDLYVFSFESDGLEKCGQRCFLVTSFTEFWHYYRQLAPTQRRHYEVIREAKPCHLYFDLEFLTANNPGLDGMALTRLLIPYVCVMLEACFGVICKPEDVIQLDASTADKFSRHLVVRLAGAAFRDNIHAGNFVKHVVNVLLYHINSTTPLQAESLRHTQQLCHESKAQNLCKHQNTATILEGDKTEPEAKKCFSSDNNDQTEMDIPAELMTSYGVTWPALRPMLVKNRYDKPTLFVDMGVYTRNRNFRLFLSSKRGKNNPLLLVSEPQAPVNDLQAPVIGAQAPTAGECMSEDSFLKYLVTHIERKDDITLLEFEAKESKSFKLTLPNRSQPAERDGTCGDSGPSPFPEVDEFIKSLVSTLSGGVDARLRRWQHVPMAGLLLYDVTGARFCENIGRQHRSNHVRYNVDLSRGVYYQTCHDPDCKAVNYKSPELLVPASVLTVYRDIDDWESVSDQGCQKTEPLSMETPSSSDRKDVKETFEQLQVSDTDLLHLVNSYEHAKSDNTESSQLPDCGESDKAFRNHQPLLGYNVDQHLQDMSDAELLEASFQHEMSNTSENELTDHISCLTEGEPTDDELLALAASFQEAESSVSRSVTNNEVSIPEVEVPAKFHEAFSCSISNEEVSDTELIRLTSSVVEGLKDNSGCPVSSSRFSNIDGASSSAFRDNG